MAIVGLSVVGRACSCRVFDAGSASVKESERSSKSESKLSALSTAMTPSLAPRRSSRLEDVLLESCEKGLRKKRSMRTDGSGTRCPSASRMEATVIRGTSGGEPA